MRATRMTPTPAEPIWDYDAIAESYGGELGWLTYSFTHEFFAAAAWHAASLFGVRRSEWDSAGIAPRISGYSNRHLFLNRRASYELAALVPGYVAFPRTIMRTMFVPAEDAAPGPNRTRLADALRFGAARMALVRQRVSELRDTREWYHQVALAVDAVRATDNELRALDASALAARLQQTVAIADLWRHAIYVDLASQWQLVRLQSMLERYQLADIAGLHGALTTSPHARTSAASALTQLATTICTTSPELASTIAASEVGVVTSLVRGDIAVAAALDAWLLAWGDRALAELKLESPSYRADDNLLGSVVKLAVVACLDQHGQQLPAIDDRAPADQGSLAGPVAATIGESGDAPLLELDTRLRMHAVRRARLRRCADRARRLVLDRELMRSERAHVYGCARAVSAELGRRLHGHGALDTETDVFELALGDLFPLINQPGHAGTLRDMVNARRAGTPSAPATPPAEATADRPRSMSGQGASAGVVTGRVRVVTRPEQVLEGAGSIIACSITDPGWTTVFPSCAGILTERGSLLGHTAVVAREYGIPAVIGIRGLLDWVVDGELVRLDGLTGVVTRIDG